MLVDTRQRDEQQSKEGFTPNVVNTEREATIKSGAKIIF
jgi:hypothetical protein